MVTLAQQVAAFCERHTLLNANTTLLAAVSGGPDSLCLLHVLRELAPQYDLNLHVAHLDHQLRHDSAADARFVADLAQAWNMPVTLGSEDVGTFARGQRIGVEAAARELRLQFLINTAQRIGATAIALGHTADDQAETVIMRLMRGAGPSGLAAMRPARPAYGVQPNSPAAPFLIRPLLETTRTQIEAYCAHHELQPRHDPSNHDPIYTRNRVRGHILPLLKTYNPSIIAALGRTARICAEEDALIENLIDQVWPTVVQHHATAMLFQRANFVQLHPALQRRMLRRAARSLVADVELEAKHLDAALAAVQTKRRRVQLPRELWLYVMPEELRLIREDTA